MASYTQVSKGSSGDSVLQLQKILNQNGYKLTEDGIFGNNTEAAVKDYQTKNGLTVDGIVGNNTWGALTSVKKSSSDTSNKSTAFDYENFTYDDYVESDTVTQANTALQTQLAAKPGEYNSQWQTQINDIISRIQGREDFSYDVNSDALYQQYKEQYSSLGKLAMQDTMGQAAAMTGGYGNSYASTVGNQAYQAYLSQLNDVVPELYGMALDKYNAEGQELYNQYGLLADQESQDYGRYQDKYNMWASETERLQNVYDTERSLDYSKYVDDRNFDYGKYSDDKNLAYNEYRNAIADEQWQQSHALDVNADKRAEEAWNIEKKNIADSSKSYSGTTAGGSSYNNGGLTDGQIKELQTALGVDADGKYGPQSKEAAGGLSAKEAYAKYVSGETTKPSYITDTAKIQEWGDAILNAETQAEALRYVERLEQLDPDLADSYYEEWLKEHGLLTGPNDTTVNPTGTGGRGGGGGLHSAYADKP